MAKVRLLSLLFLFVLSCSVHATLPDWVTTPPQEDDKFYAIGEGQSQEQAEQVALKNLLGQLRTSLEASTQQKQQLVNERFNESINIAINTKIESIPVSQYKVLKIHKESDTFYVLVSVTKPLLALTIKNEISSLLNASQQLMSGKQTGGSVLEWWFSNKQQLQSNIATTNRLLELLPLLSAEDSQLSQRFSQQQQRFSDIQNESCLYVNPMAKQDIQFALRESVVASGLISDNQNCHFSLKAEEHSDVRQLFGKHTASVELKIILFDGKRSIASEQLFETGTSMSSPDFAVRGAYQRLVEKIRRGDSDLIEQLLSN
ncbi:LPP20 family lipoprotein [Neptunicella marina]|uniref:LPP20 family lipoprotein n=1 Tax=Neptunicella marina TaxID=2125989 RepID=A0A8J6M5K7_9ALTE|nr:LPP20 family lipoprotein [Neptunicella marina]MBC3766581.1 LPP20 family lipoprotein [Neptunicella marina]